MDSLTAVKLSLVFKTELEIVKDKARQDYEEK